MRDVFLPSPTPSAPPQIMLDSRCDTPPPSYTEACSNSGSISSSSDLGHDYHQPPIYLSDEDDNDSVFLKPPTESYRHCRRKRNVERHPENESIPSKEQQNWVQHIAPRRTCTNSSLTIPHGYQQLSHRHREREMVSMQATKCSRPALRSFQCCVVPTLTPGDAYAAFEKLYEKHCNLISRSNKCLRYSIKGIRQTCVWKYTLNTVYERRQKTRHEKPYTDSSKHFGRNSNISEWDVEIDVPHDYSSTARRFKMPGSSSVSSCDRCFGKGNWSCPTCQGEGNQSCDRCGGLGHQTFTDICHEYQTDRHEIRHRQIQRTCDGCYGTTKMSCRSCFGNVLNACGKCRGTGRMESYFQVIVEWDAKEDYKFCDKLHFSDSFLKQCKGIQAYRTSARSGTVRPVSGSDCFHTGVVTASDQFTRCHKKIKSGSIVSQCQSIDVIPVYEVTVERPGKEKIFWVVGTNHNVYYPGYSHSPNCAIM